MKKLLLVLLGLMMLTSCADSKSFVIDGETVEVEPYGWGNENSTKVEGVTYDVCVGNVVWSVILVETVIAPVWITAVALWEPVSYEPNKIKVQKILK